MHQAMQRVLALMLLAASPITALPPDLQARQTLTHVVRVDAGSFQPESVVASVGDTIQFQFGSTADTATQSSFTDPCTALAGGFDSGVQNGGVFSIRVENTNPIFVMSRNGCDKGQVMAVNAPT